MRWMLLILYVDNQMDINSQNYAQFYKNNKFKRSILFKKLFKNSMSIKYNFYLNNYYTFWFCRS